MGAHSLGGAKLENSGYKGLWTTDPSDGSRPDNKDVFDNQFYQRLHEPFWTFTNIVSLCIIIFVVNYITSYHESQVTTSHTLYIVSNLLY